MQRDSPPEGNLTDWRSERPAINQRVLGRVRPSGDEVLDLESFGKSLQEVERGVLDGPFLNVTDLPYSDPTFVPRAGIWEMHGDAVKQTVRSIDDMLVTGHNLTVGTLQSHRPTSVDALVAQSRAVGARFPQDRLHGFPSDYSKAYKQVPGDPDECSSLTVAQWSPIHQRIVLFAACSQLFGSKPAPLNFSRFPSWSCWCLASLFAIPCTHCVDDMIFVERASTARSAWVSWQFFAFITGWAIDAAKSPSPLADVSVIGVAIHFPADVTLDVWISVTAKRVKSLELALLHILRRGTLGCGEAASITGKLGVTLEAAYGRVGRAKLRPLLRRAYDHHTALNNQLKSCLRWWLRFLTTMPPRRVPTSIVPRRTVVTYSDGEGSGGVGVGLFRSGHTPLAAFTAVPACIRDAWQRSKDRAGSKTDIFLIEAIGPLLALFTWPNLLKDTWWLHLIDNQGSCYSLIKRLLVDLGW